MSLNNLSELDVYLTACWKGELEVLMSFLRHREAPSPSTRTNQNPTELWKQSGHVCLKGRRAGIKACTHFGCAEVSEVFGPSQASRSNFNSLTPPSSWSCILSSNHLEAFPGTGLHYAILNLQVETVLLLLLSGLSMDERIGCPPHTPDQPSANQMWEAIRMETHSRAKQTDWGKESEEEKMWCAKRKERVELLEKLIPFGSAWYKLSCVPSLSTLGDSKTNGSETLQHKMLQKCMKHGALKELPNLHAYICEIFPHERSGESEETDSSIDSM